MFTSHQSGWTCLDLYNFFKSNNYIFSVKQVQHIFIELDVNSKAILSFDEISPIFKYFILRDDLVQNLLKTSKENNKVAESDVEKIMKGFGLNRLYEIVKKLYPNHTDTINAIDFAHNCIFTSIIFDYTPNVCTIYLCCLLEKMEVLVSVRAIAV